MSPLVLNFAIRFRCLNFSLRPLYLWGVNPFTDCMEGWVFPYRLLLKIIHIELESLTRTML